ncbi:TonB-dependent receptor domain-containing protein [Caulobacter segnis]
MWTYSVGGAWAVTSDVNFRGQFQHAIRAPNVGELYGGLAQSFDAATDPCSSRAPTAQQTAAVRAVCEATGVPAAQVFSAGVQSNTIIGNLSGGNPNVGIEKSDTYTVGVVLTPRMVPGLAVSVDYFNIDLTGAISQLGGGLNNTLNLCYYIVQSASSEFCQAIKRNPVTGEIALPYYATVTNANTGGLKTAGVDFAANYRFKTDFRLAARRQQLRHLDQLDLDRRVHFDARPGLPEHQELLRRGVRHDLRPADPGMEGRHADHLAHGPAQPQRQAPLHRRGDDRQVPAAQAAGRHRPRTWRP